MSGFLLLVSIKDFMSLSDKSDKSHKKVEIFYKRETVLSIRNTPI